MMAEPALHHLSATELAGRITRRELSAREYLEHIASRVEAHNQTVNAVVTLDLERRKPRSPPTRPPRPVDRRGHCTAWQ
jgi:Asp-tRNA(Asn)/Glu-tRNA(Gln) amidotransferase A subunit family amidase